jgi:hypothetical protein
MTEPHFWARWVGATAVGVLVAAAGFIAIYSVIGEPGDVLFPMLMTGIGATIGAFQQRVLRRRLGTVNRWSVATGVGFGTGIAVAVAMGERHGLGAKVLMGLVNGAFVGAIVGTLQWRVLDGRVPSARLWVPVSIVGWAIAAAAADTAGYFVDGLDIIVAPIVAAALTGIALAALIEPSRSARQQSPQLRTHRSTPRSGTRPNPG